MTAPGPESDPPPALPERSIATLAEARSSLGKVRKHPPFLLYGVLLMTGGVAADLIGVSLGLPRLLLSFDQGLSQLLYNWQLVTTWYSGVPIALGMALIFIDLFILFDKKRYGLPLRHDPVDGQQVTVVLTAYNDQDSIAEAVLDFKNHPRVARVIVVSNNSSDLTAERAEEAGAIVVNETSPGYGRCVYRCLTESLKYTDTHLTLLCEGDRTFRAYDIEKFLAYIPHADIVNGTRTTESLREHETQLTTFMYYGNMFVGKLLEAKHLGRGTLSDVGTTYKIFRNNALGILLPALNPKVNLEFNAHLLDQALAIGAVVIECPISFHPRVGVSKGGNINNWRGFTVGLRMIGGITFGWPEAK